MYLYHLFHGQTIRVHWMPTNLCANYHCEYHNLIILLIIEVALGNLIMCHGFQCAFTHMPSAVLSFFHLIIFIIIVTQSGGDGQKAQDSPVSQQTGQHCNVQLDDEETEGLRS